MCSERLVLIVRRRADVFCVTCRRWVFDCDMFLQGGHYTHSSDLQVGLPQRPTGWSVEASTIKGTGSSEQRCTVVGESTQA